MIDNSVGWKSPVLVVKRQHMLQLQQNRDTVLRLGETILIEVDLVAARKTFLNRALPPEIDRACSRG